MLVSRILVAAYFCILTTNIFGSFAFAQSVSTDHFIYERQQPIVASFKGAPGNRQDYIGVGYPGLPDSAVYHWSYVDGKTEGSITIQAALPTARYEIRLYDGPTRQVIARQAFLVGSPNCRDEAIAQTAECRPALDVPEEVMIQQPFIVGFEGGGTGRSPDFITLVPAGTPDGQRGKQKFQLRDVLAGTQEFIVDKPGAYEVRFHVAGAREPIERATLTAGETAVAKPVEAPAKPSGDANDGGGQAIKVAEPEAPKDPSDDEPNIATDRFIYEAQDTVALRIFYENAPARSNIMVTIGFPGRPSSAIYNGARLSQSTEGEVSITARLPSGRYEARIYDVTARAVLARAPFLVGGPNCLDPAKAQTEECAPNLYVDPEFEFGQPIRVKFEGGGTGLRQDLITVVPTGAQDGSWPRNTTLALKEAFAGEHNFRVDAPGSYEARFHVAADPNPIQRVIFEVLPLSKDFKLNAELFYGAEADSTPPDIWEPIQSVVGAGLKGRWLAELQCNDRRRDTAFLLDLTDGSRAEAVFLRGNNVVGLNYTVRSTETGADLLPKEWTDNRMQLSSPLELALQMKEKGGDLEGTVKGDPTCTTFLAAQFAYDDRDWDDRGYVTVWENLGAAAFSLERCVAVTAWMVDGEEFLIGGAVIPTQILNRETFRLVTGVPFDQWDRRAAKAHTDMKRHCHPLMSQSVDVSVRQTLSALETSGLVSHFLSLLASRTPGASLTEDGRFLQAYTRVLQVRLAMAHVAKGIASLRGETPTATTLGQWDEAIALLQDGTGRAAQLPLPVRLKAIERMKTVRNSATAEWTLAEIAAVPTALESVDRIIELATKAIRVLGAESDSAARIATTAHHKNHNVLSAEVNAEISAMNNYEGTLQDFEVLTNQAILISETVSKSANFSGEYANVIALGDQLSSLSSEAAFGEILDHWEMTLEQRSVELARAATRDYEAELQLVPATHEGLRNMHERNEEVAGLIKKGSSEEEVKAYVRLFETRSNQITEQLLENAQERLAAFAKDPRDGGAPWQWAKEIDDFAQNLIDEFEGRKANVNPPAEIQAAAAREIEVLASAQLPEFTAQAESTPRTWAGVTRLTNDHAAISASPHAAAFDRYTSFIEEELSNLFDALELEARQRVHTFGRSHRDVAALYDLSQQQRQRFQTRGEAQRAKALHAAANQRAAEILRVNLPIYESEIAAIEPTYKAVEELKAAAYGFDRDRSIHGGFNDYAALARNRAEAMRASLCDVAASGAGLTKALSEQLILVSGAPVAARQFVCDLDAMGHEVREFASPGSLASGSDVTLKVAQREDGPFDFVVLQSVEALPGQILLVGSEVGDALRRQPVDLEEWAAYTALLIGAQPSTPSGGQKSVFTTVRQSSVWIVVAWSQPCKEDRTQLCGAGVSGTGSFIGANHVLTNAHVVENDNELLESGFVASPAFGVRPYRLVKNARRQTGSKIDAAVIEVLNYEHPTFLTFASDYSVDQYIASAGYPGLAGGLDARYKDTYWDVGFGRPVDPDALPTPVVVEGRVNNIVVDRASGARDLLYTMETAGGASGSPIVNECGQLVGLHYQGARAEVQGGTVSSAKYNAGVAHPHIEDFLKLADIPFSKAEKPCSLER